MQLPLPLHLNTMDVDSSSDAGQPTVAAVIVSLQAGVRSCGVAVLAPRDRTHVGDVKTRALRLYQFIDEAQHVWLGRLLHGSQIMTCYIADAGLTPEDMKKLLAV